MRKFTKSFLALALFTVGAVNLNAQEDEIIDFDGSFYHTWSEVSATATDNGEAGGGVKIGEEVGLGGTIWGNLSGKVPYLNYANITEYSELRFEGTPGAVIRLMCNRLVDEGPIYEIKPTIGEDGKLTVNISDLKYLNDGTACDFVCLQSIKVPAGWQGGTTAATITSIKIVKPGDPLSVPKTGLKNAINEGKKQNAFGKTTASWNALQTAITDGETELANGSATAESLNAAAKAITDAIAGLKLQDGYTNLTKDMYYSWDSATAPTTGSSNSGACDYVLFSSTSQPYGHGGVPLLSFADLSTFDKFEILATGGLPRILLNRDVDNGQWSDIEAESHLIDNTKGDGDSWHAKYYATEGSNVTVDLKQLANDKGFAHLHTIKTVGGNVTVTDMLLYRTLVVGASKYATFGSLYKNAKPNDVTAYAAKLSGNKLVLTEVTNVPAGKGVIVEATAAGSYAPTFDVDADDIDTDLLVSNGTVTGDESTIYVLADGNNGIGFYLLKSGQKVPAGKAYLEVASGDAPEFIGFGGTTGIENLAPAFSKGEGAVYDLQGRKVAQPTKGLYIVNGKKVVIK